MNVFYIAEVYFNVDERERVARNLDVTKSNPIIGYKRKIELGYAASEEYKKDFIRSTRLHLSLAYIIGHKSFDFFFFSNPPVHVFADQIKTGKKREF